MNFEQYIQGIYGDISTLDRRTLNQLRQVWNTNPQLIINTYNQKHAPDLVQNTPTRVAIQANPNLSRIQTPIIETAQDDLSAIDSFQKAFKLARQKGLKQFKWKSTKSNSSGLFGTESVSSIQKKNQNNQSKSKKEKKNTEKESKAKTQPSKDQKDIQSYTDDIVVSANKPANTDYRLAVAIPQMSIPRGDDSSSRQQAYERGTYLDWLNNRPTNNMFRTGYSTVFNPGFYQYGGQLNMNEQQLQQAFIQFLAQKIGAKNQQELEAAIQQLGEEGLKQVYAEFMQMMQQQQVQAAKFGAKLNYIKSLRGQCPEGYEISYYKVGGTLCKKCMKKQQEMKDGGQVPKNPIDEFKCGRKMKKAQGGAVDFEKCGGKTKKTKKKEEGGELNSTKNPKAFSKMALAKCGAKLKEACKGMQMNKCGKKLKKKAIGGTVSTNKGTGQKPCK